MAIIRRCYTSFCTRLGLKTTWVVLSSSDERLNQAWKQMIVLGSIRCKLNRLTNLAMIILDKMDNILFWLIWVSTLFLVIPKVKMLSLLQEQRVPRVIIMSCHNVNCLPGIIKHPTSPVALDDTSQSLVLIEKPHVSFGNSNFCIFDINNRSDVTCCQTELFNIHAITHGLANKLVWDIC